MIKKNEQSCFDSSKYKALEFELQAPPNASGRLTLTQMDKDCKHRIMGMLFFTINLKFIEKSLMPIKKKMAIQTTWSCPSSTKMTDQSKR
jgi:hypothetical protein